MGSFVLDTSSLRGVSKATLERAAEKKLDVCVSPISLWELLCHLDEGTPEDFERPKGRMLRAWRLRVLDDPFAAHALAVGAAGAANPTRFEDRVVLGKVLDLLATAPTLEAFYTCVVNYPGGEVGEVRDCAERARQTLKVSEERHVDQIKKVCGLLEREVGRPQLMAPTREFVQAVVAGAKHLAAHYEQSGISSDGLVERIFSSTYPHLGYLFERARTYIVATAVGDSPQIDGNDMEDAAILLHLDLSEPRALVTDDGGTRKALGTALSRLETMLSTTGETAVIRSRVLTSSEFSKEVDAAPVGS